MITIQKKSRHKEQELVLFRIENTSGAYIEVLNYGATLTSIVVPDQTGKKENIILGYNNIEDYLSDQFYLGSTIGRFANRIAKARFDLDGSTYHLDKNDGENSNHSGSDGFNFRIFDHKITEDKIILSLESKDGDGGFPGNIHFSVIYSFSDNNELIIGYKVIADKKTIFNPTNHAYFNLTAGKENILNHELKIQANDYLESDNQFIPTGKILPVAKTGFDFREYRKIAEMMPLKNEILKGYNTYFIGNNNNEKLQLLASLKEHSSGRNLDVYSTTPGVQVYTGDYLSGAQPPFGGVCIEAQFFPDFPNHPHFDQLIILPGQECSQIIKYAFSTV